LGRKTGGSGEGVEDLGVFGFLHKLGDSVLCVHTEEAETWGTFTVDRQGGDGDIRPGGVVPFEHLAEIHPVELIPGKDKDVIVGVVIEMD
jgi:hypothetical protein